MTERLITLKQLSDLTGIYIDTLRTYLQGYRFTKFNRGKTLYCYNAELKKTLIDFLYLKHKRDLAENIKKRLLVNKSLSV